jgi:pimeloyl-ACP methyl ester carboxylesterase
VITPDPSSVRYPGPWRHIDVHAGGIRFHAAAGLEQNPTAPLVLMLHGFADFWWTWRHQIEPLSDAGFRVLAVDLRGSGDTDKPPRGYDPRTLSRDISGLIRASGAPSAHLVAHADGGVGAWMTGLLHPALVRSVALVSSPHPNTLRHRVLHDSAQRSAFLPQFLRYQPPKRPERMLTRGDGAYVEALIESRTAPQFIHAGDYADIARKMRSAIQIPAAAHSGLEYQRWAFRSQFRPDGAKFRRVAGGRMTLPVLHAHGDADPFILRPAVADSIRHAPSQRLLPIAGAGHWAHWEKPDEFTAALVDFIADAEGRV